MRTQALAELSRHQSSIGKKIIQAGVVWLAADPLRDSGADACDGAMRGYESGSAQFCSCGGSHSDVIPGFQMTGPEQWLALYNRLMAEIAAKRVPERRPRSNPRVVKRKMPHFPLKRLIPSRPP
jgi:hypothetical protein